MDSSPPHAPPPVVRARLLVGLVHPWPQGLLHRLCSIRPPLGSGSVILCPRQLPWDRAALPVSKAVAPARILHLLPDEAQLVAEDGGTKPTALVLLDALAGARAEHLAIDEHLLPSRVDGPQLGNPRPRVERWKRSLPLPVELSLTVSTMRSGAPSSSMYLPGFPLAAGTSRTRPSSIVRHKTTTRSYSTLGPGSTDTTRVLSEKTAPCSVSTIRACSADVMAVFVAPWM